MSCGYVLKLDNYIGHVVTKVSTDELLKYEDDPVLHSEIIAEMPDKPQSTLSHHKAKFLGHLPRNRDEYDPSIILSKSQKGARVIALGIFKFTLCPNCCIQLDKQE